MEGASPVSADLRLLPPLLLTPDEVAYRLRVTARTVRRWCQEGRLRSFRHGKVVRIYADDLAAALTSGHLAQATPR